MNQIQVRIVNLLADEEAIVGNSEHLTTGDIADQLDTTQIEVANLLSELNCVLNGPDASESDQWQLDGFDMKTKADLQRECGRCGKVSLFYSSNDPCPECGSTNKLTMQSVECHETVGVTDDIKGTLESIYTKRKGTVFDTSSYTVHSDVSQFIGNLLDHPQSPDWGKVLAQNVVAQEIKKEVNKVKARGIDREYFRARTFTPGNTPTTPKLTSPPAKFVNSPGRYNPSGDSVLYVSRTVDTAASEANPDQNQVVYIQKFHVNVPEIEYLEIERDMSNRCPHLHHLLLLSEYLPKDIGTVEAYWPTHFLRFVCEEIGMSAIEFPSVRGDYPNESDSINLVVFGDKKSDIDNMTHGSPFEYCSFTRD